VTPVRNKTLLLVTVDTEASMVGLRPLEPEQMVWGRVGDGTWGIERMMDICDAHGVKATFFISTLEALHYGDDHIRSIAEAVAARGHDPQVHVHPIWLGGKFAQKSLSAYGLEDQSAAIGQAVEVFRRLCGSEPLAHRAGGLWCNAATFQALAEVGIRLDSSVARGYHTYELGVEPPNVPRRLAALAEVPVTVFAQVRLGRWASWRHFDINACTLAELRFVVEAAAREGVAALCLLMHSFSFLRRGKRGQVAGPAPEEARKFERLLDHVAARQHLEVVTFRDLAERLEGGDGILDGPDFAPVSGPWRTYCRSWQRFGASWKNKAVALAPPAAAAAAAGAIWWLSR